MIFWQDHGSGVELKKKSRLGKKAALAKLGLYSDFSFRDDRRQVAGQKKPGNQTKKKNKWRPSRAKSTVPRHDCQRRVSRRPRRARNPRLRADASGARQRILPGGLCRSKC